jgi:hypothetical protein
LRKLILTFFCLIILFGCDDKAENHLSAGISFNFFEQCFEDIAQSIKIDKQTINRRDALKSVSSCYGIGVSGIDLINDEPIMIGDSYRDEVELVIGVLNTHNYELFFSIDPLGESFLSEVVIKENDAVENVNVQNLINNEEQNEAEKNNIFEVVKEEFKNPIDPLGSKNSSLEQAWFNLQGDDQKEGFIDSIGITKNTGNLLLGLLEDISVSLETKLYILNRIEIEDSFIAKSIALEALSSSDKDVALKAIEMIYSWNDISMAEYLIPIINTHLDSEVKQEAEKLYQLFSEDIQDAESIQLSD